MVALTKQEPAVTLSEPVFTRPAPFPGCAECGSLDRAWVRATTPGSPTFDLSRATDYVVVMRRHKAAAHRRPS
jgi:hypothetical protein